MNVETDEGLEGRIGRTVLVELHQADVISVSASDEQLAIREWKNSAGGYRRLFRKPERRINNRPERREVLSKGGRVEKEEKKREALAPSPPHGAMVPPRRPQVKNCRPSSGG